jgi:hypothetical protein
VHGASPPLLIIARYAGFVIRSATVLKQVVFARAERL